MFSSTKMLAVFAVLTFVFAYIIDMPVVTLPTLAMFCAQLFLLAISIDFRRAGIFRIVVLTSLLSSVLFYMLTHSTAHYLPGVDSYIFFTGAEAVKQNQSPYSGAAASAHNLGFVPIYALCAVMGDSIHEFQRNLLRIDMASWVVILAVIAAGLVYFFKRYSIGSQDKIEILLQVASLIVLFSLFFRWDRSLGNFCTLLASLVILMMVSSYFDKPLLTGLILGMTISLKPYFLALGVGYAIYLVMKRDKESLVILLSAAFLLGGTALALELVKGGLGSNTYVEFFTKVSRKNIPAMMDNVDNLSAWAVLLLPIFKNLGIPLQSYLRNGFTLFISLLAYCGGLYLCVNDSRKRMPMEHIVYYLFLTTAIYPLLWERYFAWILGPALCLVCMLNVYQRRKELIPSFLFCCCVLMFPPIAWIGAFGLPVLVFADAIRCQKEASGNHEEVTL